MVSNMLPIPLPATPDDDSDFIQVVNTFIEHYAQLYRPPGIIIHHVDNWFGQRWLGFAGKFQGLAGVRNRSVKNSLLPLPPFRPSRILSYVDLASTEDGAYQLFDHSSHGMHEERNGGQYRHLHRLNLYCWYSGSTKLNTNGSLMIYDVTPEGSTGWYIGFSRNTGWCVAQTVNISRDECQRIYSTGNN